MGMLTKEEAQRIALCVSAIRPDWSTNGLMSVLADDRCRNRVPRDLTLAFVALALDPSSRKPTRIYESGPWWDVARPAGQTPPNYRAVLPTDCGICSRPFEHHSALSKLDDHEYEPLSDRKPGVGPTPEQRAAIEAARVQAKKARPEPAPKREPRDPADVIAEHTKENA
mgnify:FL=1